MSRAVKGAGVCVGAGAVFLAWAARGRSSRVFGDSVYRGDRSRPAVALTFDDGPSERTPELLELLDRNGAAATFFQCGRNVERLPEVAMAVHRAGHEIGNHSFSHSLMCFRSSGFIQQDLERTQRAIATVTGRAPCWFRAPFGVRWFGVRAAQHRLGLRGVMWSLLARDWKLGAGSIVGRVVAGLENGAIICLHDGRELTRDPNIRETLQALRRLLPLIRQHGYRFETVSQILCPTT